MHGAEGVRQRILQDVQFIAFHMPPRLSRRLGGLRRAVAIARYCKQRGYQLMHIYTDAGVSALHGPGREAAGVLGAPRGC